MIISHSKEDYIRAIYNLNGSQKKVNNKSIAKELSVSAASVTEMNNRLVKEGLISHFPYKGVQLTEQGIRTANQLIRKHRIWEVFLYENLDYKWGEVHDEADRLEHASSDILIERLSEFLGDPKYDPHGEIIPNADGTVDKPTNSLVSLDTLEKDTTFIVKEVVDDREFLEYLYHNNLILNQKYMIVKKDTYDETVILLNIETNKQIQISGKALRNIKVKVITSK